MKIWSQVLFFIQAIYFSDLLLTFITWRLHRSGRNGLPHALSRAVSTFVVELKQVFIKASVRVKPALKPSVATESNEIFSGRETLKFEGSATFQELTKSRRTFTFWRSSLSRKYFIWVHRMICILNSPFLEYDKH